MALIAAGSDFDLVEDDAHTFDDLVGNLRTWLGFAGGAAHCRFRLLSSRFCFGSVIGAVALGWRTPLCTTALREMQRGVLGDPAPWRAATGASLPSLRETLSRMPATIQERRYARLWPLKPALIVGLALFWLLSGAIGLVSLDAAAQRADRARHAGQDSARGLVVAGSLIDLTLAAASCCGGRRRWRWRACWRCRSAISCSAPCSRPICGAIPLGPYVKILPGYAVDAGRLGLAGGALMETILVLRYLHIVGATVLLGTGMGIAFFMLMAHRTRDAQADRSRGADGGHRGFGVHGDRRRRPTDHRACCWPTPWAGD